MKRLIIHYQGKPIKEYNNIVSLVLRKDKILDLYTNENEWICWMNYEYDWFEIYE